MNSGQGWSCLDSGAFAHPLAQSPLVRRSLAEFRRLTGLAASLLRLAAPTGRFPVGHQENEFYSRIAPFSGACPVCRWGRAKLLRQPQSKWKRQQTCYPAATVNLAVPVIASGRQAITIPGISNL